MIAFNVSFNVSLSFREVKMADGGGPAVVHCSAGVGRTGTLLALDIGIQGILQGDSKIDVLRIVSTLRQDRPGMVQTKDQYRFVHQVCNNFYQSCCMCARVLQVLAHMVCD